jgi:ABC-type bacteriocin/lantibiotic exporter with double-glycine peptidase domain
MALDRIDHRREDDARRGTNADDVIYAAIVHGNAGLPGVLALYIQRNSARVLLQVILALALGGLALLPPVLIGSLIDRVIEGTIDVRLAWFASAAVFALAALDGALTWVRKRKAVDNEISLRAATADTHFRSCMRLPASEFQKGNHLFLIRSFDDLDNVVEVIAGSSAEIFANATVFTAYAALMLVTDVRLGTVLLALAVLSLATSIVTTRASRLACENWLPVRDARFSHVVECVTSMPTIKTLGAHTSVAGPFARQQAEEDSALSRYRNHLALADAARRFWSVASPGIGAVAGMLLVIDGSLTAGAFVMFLAIVPGFSGILSALHSEAEKLGHASAALARMRQVASADQELLSEGTVSRLTVDAVTRLELRNLGFRHRGSSLDTLTGIDMAIFAGEHVAIMGLSGRGKTTLNALLARLHEPQDGEIAIDGHPVAASDLSEHRRRLVLVPHSIAVFSADLRDNVRLWDEEISDDLIIAALDKAKLGLASALFPQALDTLLGERGNPLSAGQRQRLGLARVFLRKPAILIVDEATSSLDHETEQAVLSNLRRHMAGRILLFVTHRRQIADTLDRIVNI